MSRPNQKRIQKRIDEATKILTVLGLPAEQQNDRSALTLLALLALGPQSPWDEARSHLIGVTPIMEFIESAYHRKYAPNSRETIRRFTLHQFVDAGLVELNPDEPTRPTNSPKNVYQIRAAALTLLQHFGSSEWSGKLNDYLGAIETLRDRYSVEREMMRIPLILPDGETISLSPGGQNVIVKKIIEDFCPRFTPGASAIYVGDTGGKWAYFDEAGLNALGVTVGEHGKIPDIIIHLTERNWLVLIEAVTSHGPMNPKRVSELKALFSSCTAGLVFVTAFPDVRTFTRYASDISWETEVWIAEAPSHMIHFNGERFLGPY
ncbi:MAG: restriction endonuclease [Candidatus Hydrogenedentes bacterium]|nr:restriction endonuclease [Candidatus Hydrogenedentota bacterium]